MVSKIFSASIDLNSPLVATAVHDGHSVRPELEKLFKLSENERLREEDPHTGQLAKLFPTYILGNYSRFETDLNRPREKAVYQIPEDAWGLDVWQSPLSTEIVNQSLANYDHFYSEVADILTKIIDKHSYAVVYDLHTYNHMRNGADGEPANPNENPEINLGIGNMDVAKWRPVINAFTDSYKKNSSIDVDIRENVKFNGGNFMHQLHNKFGSSICVISIEFKKTFMNEWTNELDQGHFDRISKSLKATEGNVLAAATAIHKNP